VGYGFEPTYEAANWILDVADGVAAHACIATARDVYVKVRAVDTSRFASVPPLGVDLPLGSKCP